MKALLTEFWFWLTDPLMQLGRVPNADVVFNKKLFTPNIMEILPENAELEWNESKDRQRLFLDMDGERVLTAFPDGIKVDIGYISRVRFSSKFKDEKRRRELADLMKKFIDALNEEKASQKAFLTQP